ncbi:MAG: preprotein translocase subunit SecE [Patescibacteria group bacterium]
MSQLGNYLRATAAEMKQVSWPSRATALAYTAIVIGISILAAIFLGAFDYVFTQFIDLIVSF